MNARNRTLFVASVSALFLAVHPSLAWTAEIDLGCARGALARVEAGIPPVPRPDEASKVHFDSKAMRAWVAAHPTSSRPAAEFVAANLEYVPQKAFEAELFASMDSYLALHPDIAKAQKKLAVLHYAELPGQKKSGGWVAALLKERYPGIQAETLEISKDIDALKKAVASTQGSLYLLVDDASYSGTQLRDAWMILGLVGVKPDVVTPFVTQRALRVFDKASQSQSRIHYRQVMPSVMELLEKAPGDDEARELLDEQVMNLILTPNVPLFVFEHKLPDGYSFPARIADGVVPEGANIPFLRQGTPIYKR